MSAELRVPYCPICKHSTKRHNDLGYCQVWGKRMGYCDCDGTISCGESVAAQIKARR